MRTRRLASSPLPIQRDHSASTASAGYQRLTRFNWIARECDRQQGNGARHGRAA